MDTLPGRPEGPLSAQDLRDYEGLFDRWKALYQRAHYGQTLLKHRDVPILLSRMGSSQFYVMPHFEEQSLSQWVVFVRDLGKAPNGRHIHQGGIAIFGIEGDGYSIVDGRRLNWGAGDVLYLPLVPGGLDHQHFPANIGDPCRFMGIIYEPLIVAVGAEMTQLEPHENEHTAADASMFAAPPPATGRPLVEPTLEGLFALRQHDREHRRVPPLIRQADLPIDETAFGDLRWYLHPGRAGFAGTAPILLFSQTLEPGQRSATLHTPGNGFAHVLEGVASISVDDEEHQCGIDDMVMLPSRKNGVRTTVQADPDGPSKVLFAFANLSGLGGMGMGADFSIEGE